MQDTNRARHPSAVFAVSLTGLVTVWSAGAEQLFGVSEADAVGRPVIGVADWHLTHRNVETYERIGVGGVWVYRNLVTTRDDTVHGLATTASVGRDSQGKLEVILYMEEVDIARAESWPRAPYIRTVGEPSELTFFCGPDGVIRFAGAAILPMTGYLARDVVGRDVLSFIHPEDHAAWSTAFDAALATPKTMFAVVVRVRFGDGAWHWVSERITNMIDDEAVAALVVNSSDLTPARPAHGLPALSGLTARESEVLNRLLLGDRVPAVAQSLFISQSTVRNLLSSIYAKVGVSSQQELIGLVRSTPPS